MHQWVSVQISMQVPNNEYSCTHQLVGPQPAHRFVKSHAARVEPHDERHFIEPHAAWLVQIPDGSAHASWLLEPRGNRLIKPHAAQLVEPHTAGNSSPNHAHGGSLNHMDGSSLNHTQCSWSNLHMDGSSSTCMQHGSSNLEMDGSLSNQVLYTAACRNICRAAC